MTKHAPPPICPLCKKGTLIKADNWQERGYLEEPLDYTCEASWNMETGEIEFPPLDYASACYVNRLESELAAAYEAIRWADGYRCGGIEGERLGWLKAWTNNPAVIKAKRAKP